MIMCLGLLFAAGATLAAQRLAGAARTIAVPILGAGVGLLCAGARVSLTTSLGTARIAVDASIASATGDGRRAREIGVGAVGRVISGGGFGGHGVGAGGVGRATAA